MQDEKLAMPCSDEMDENFRRLKYIRYADDFLVGVIGSKSESERIKADIAAFMRGRLKLELSTEKTLITHAQEEAKFLGFHITVRSLNVRKRNRKGALERGCKGKVMLKLSSETGKDKLQNLGTISFTQKDGKVIWRPKIRTALTGMDADKMVAKYNLEIRGFYNYYCIANNDSATCADISYIMLFCIYMT